MKFTPFPLTLTHTHTHTHTQKKKENVWTSKVENFLQNFVFDFETTKFYLWFYFRAGSERKKKILQRYGETRSLCLSLILQKKKTRKCSNIEGWEFFCRIFGISKMSYDTLSREIDGRLTRIEVDTSAIVEPLEPTYFLTYTIHAQCLHNVCVYVCVCVNVFHGYSRDECSLFQNYRRNELRLWEIARKEFAVLTPFDQMR